MIGVEILSSTEVACEFAFNWTAFWIAFGIMVCIAAFMAIVPVIQGECEWWIIPICLFIGVVGGIMMGGAMGEAASTPTAYENHYKATIDDSVSMNEFLEKYEIISQEGKIYTIKEKN